MPIYAFICTACGHRFDRLQKLSDPDPGACPDCGADAIKRQLTAPSFRLSGGGWYETDFKKDGDRKRNLAGEGGEGANPAVPATPTRLTRSRRQLPIQAGFEDRNQAQVRSEADAPPKSDSSPLPAEPNQQLPVFCSSFPTRGNDRSTREAPGRRAAILPAYSTER